MLYMVAEVIGAWWTGSLALLADAGHMFTDVAALILALIAVWFGSRPATSRKTFGYYRLEIIAALVNGVALVVISLFIFYGAYERWLSPPVVKSGPMIVVAAGGLIVNLACAWILHAREEVDLNMRGAWMHVMGDALGSVAAILAGVCMALFGWYAGGRSVQRRDQFADHLGLSETDQRVDECVAGRNSGAHQSRGG